MRARDAYRKIIGREAMEAIARIRERLDRQAERLGRLEKRGFDTYKEAEFHVREMKRIAPQLAALERRVEEIRQRLEAAPRVDEPAELAESRSLIEEVRREHAQVRVRLSAVTSYEERLRRIEEKLGLPHE
jgi:DNA repair ATPase RecN